MHLIFHDARPEPTAAGPAMLTIEHKGACSLSIAAVAQLGLLPGHRLIPVQDADTNAWYLLLAPQAPLKGFELRPRDKSSQALMFHSSARVRAYWQAHGLNGQKSVRALVAATPVEHEGLRLYPLTPHHPTIAPPTATEATEPATVEDTPLAAEPLHDLPAVADAVPTLAAGAPASEECETTDERMERLTDHWYNLDIKQCPDAELTELVSLLADKPKKDRDIVENQMLNRGKTEIERRKKSAGKGGRRG